MELLLWRWSVGVQFTSLAMIAVFFLVLERSLRLGELRLWVGAWAANLVALGITFLYWNWRPTGTAFRAIAAGYLGAKTVFAVLLILGALRLRRLMPWPRPGIRLGAGVLLYTLCGFFVPTLEVLGVVANLALTVLFVAGGLLLLRPPRDVGMSWLATAMLLRAGLDLASGVAFALTAMPAGDAPSSLLGLARSFVAVHSFVDTGAEWLLALAGVLALSDRVSGELRQYNRDLLAAQEDLRRLADRDPLTALMNRRVLPEVMRRVQPVGALVFFFDLDGFKAVNDLHGHQVGDDCLRRFAHGLRECFRPGDTLVRYAGDEFVVVAQGLDKGAAQERVDRLRARLRGGGAATPDMAFSVGTAVLEPGGQPDAALQAADRAMYEAKLARAGTPA